MTDLELLYNAYRDSGLQTNGGNRKFTWMAER